MGAQKRLLRPRVVRTPVGVAKREDVVIGAGLIGRADVPVRSVKARADAFRGQSRIEPVEIGDDDDVGLGVGIVVLQGFDIGVAAGGDALGPARISVGKWAESQEGDANVARRQVA